MHVDPRVALKLNLLAVGDRIGARFGRRPSSYRPPALRARLR
jgi:hypothetical protein